MWVVWTLQSLFSIDLPLINSRTLVVQNYDYELDHR